MKATVDRTSAEYARAAEKVFAPQPTVRYTETRGHFEVQGSQGGTYAVFLEDDGAYGCACRYGRLETLCYHVVAVDEHRREALARFEAEVTCKPFLPASRKLAILRQRELNEHRASCAKCGAGVECRRAGKLLERMGALARRIAQAA